MSGQEVAVQGVNPEVSPEPTEGVVLDPSTGDSIADAMRDGAEGSKWTEAEAEAAFAALAERSASWDSHVGVVAFKTYQAGLVGAGDGQRTKQEWADRLGVNPVTDRPYSGQYFGQAAILGAAIVLYGWEPGSDMYRRLRQARTDSALKAHLNAAVSAPPEDATEAAHSRDKAASLIGKALAPVTGSAGADTSTDTSTQPTTPSRAVKAAEALAVLLGNPWKSRPTDAEWIKVRDALVAASDALVKVQTVEKFAEAEAAASGRLRASAEGNGRNGVTEPSAPGDAEAEADAPEADAEPTPEALAEAAEAEAEAVSDAEADAPKPGPSRKRASRK